MSNGSTFMDSLQLVSDSLMPLATGLVAVGVFSGLAAFSSLVMLLGVSALGGGAVALGSPATLITVAVTSLAFSSYLTGMIFGADSSDKGMDK
jgi:hypothetical protein